MPALLAIGIFVVYVAIVALLWRLTGTHYDHLVDSSRTIWRGIVLPIGVGGAFVASATVGAGWWAQALFPGSSAPAWTAVVPVLLAVVIVLNLASIDWRAPQVRLMPLILLGTLCVGFAEELVTRGQLVAGLREAGANGWVVWLVSSVLFAALHGINVLFGQSRQSTATQVVMTFFAGTAFYVTLLVTGSLLVGIVLHALWDLATLGLLATGGKQRPVPGFIGLAAFAVALVAIVVTLI